MDCEELNFEGLSFGEVLSLIARCGPGILSAWIAAGRTNPAVPQPTAEQLAEIERIQSELDAAKRREERNRLLLPAIVVGAVILARR